MSPTSKQNFLNFDVVPIHIQFDHAKLSTRFGSHKQLLVSRWLSGPFQRNQVFLIMNWRDQAYPKCKKCVLSSGTLIFYWPWRIKPDFVRGKHQRRRPAWSSAQSDQRLCCLHYGKYVKLKMQKMDILASLCSSAD